MYILTLSPSSSNNTIAILFRLRNNLYNNPYVLKSNFAYYHPYNHASNPHLGIFFILVFFFSCLFSLLHFKNQNNKKLLK